MYKEQNFTKLSGKKYTYFIITPLNNTYIYNHLFHLKLYSCYMGSGYKNIFIISSKYVFAIVENKCFNGNSTLKIKFFA